MTSDNHGPARRLLRVRFAIALISVGYLVAGISWARGGPGFPFGVARDPLAEHQSILENLSQAHGSWWVIACAGAGLVVVAAMGTSLRSTTMAMVLVVVGAIQFVAYTLLIPDGRPLIAAAHIPILLAGKPFGWPPGVTIGSQVSWPVANQVILMALGALWLAATVVYFRIRRRACLTCGRSTTHSETWTRPERAAVWGRQAVAAAAAVPVFYAITRLAWFVGVPLGVPQSFLDDESADNPTIFVAGAFMASLALGAAALTLGLVQRWGEVYPRWIPRLRGRPVRPRTALIPAVVASVLLIGAGLGWVRAATHGWFPDSSGWGTTAPGALLPVWGVSLGVAAYAYYLRRRGTCPQCSRGVTLHR